MAVTKTIVKRRGDQAQPEVEIVVFGNVAGLAPIEKVQAHALFGLDQTDKYLLQMRF